jgi:hypothetical protein
MVDIVKFNFYRVEECGYYLHGRGTPEFGSLGSIFDELKSWAFDGSRPLLETCTYEAVDGSGMLHTYCFDFRRSANGDIFITTWNETETIDGNTASVRGSDPAGSAHVNTTAVPAGHIPGYPTYFWFIPSANIFATLRFNSARSNGHAGIKLLLDGFIKIFTSHSVFDSNQPAEARDLLGYRENDRNPVQTNLRASFKSYPAKLAGRIQHLKDNRTNITKVLRKSTLLNTETDDRDLWQRLLQNLGVTTSPALVNDVKVKTELPYLPSATELEQIIAEWESGSSLKWDNVGFHLLGEADTVWLSHSLIKDERDLNIIKDGNGIVSLRSVERELARHRTQLLNLLS